MSCHCFCQRVSLRGATITALPTGDASGGGLTASGGARVADTVGACGSTAAATCRNNATTLSMHRAPSMTSQVRNQNS